jgi:hypothetical protein
MKNGSWIFWVIGLGSLVLMGATLFYNYYYATSLACDQQGIFGDMFGASNAFFTGLSFTGVIIAILLQRQELRFQREELELTRNEMERTRKEFELQNSTLLKQQFENTFFQMLRLFHENTEKINSIENRFKGKSIFSQVLNNLDVNINTAFKKRFNSCPNKAIFEDYSEFYDEEVEKTSVKDFTDLFNVIIARFEDDLSVYFTNLQNILKLIDKSDIDDKPYYISVIVSQFIKSEIKTIFYYTISNTKESGFRILVEKYGLLESVKKMDLFNDNIYLEYKPKSKSKLLLL